MRNGLSSYSIDWTRVRSALIWLVPTLLFLALVYYFTDNPKTERQHISQGRSDYDQGHFTSSLNAYNEAVKENRNNGTTYLERAFTLYAQGEYESAIRDLNRALDLGLVRPVKAYSVRAAAYHALGQNEQAFADLVLVEKTPRDDLVHYLLAWTYVEFGKYELAIPEATQAIEEHHQPMSYAYTTRGHSYYRLGQYKKALDDYNQALHFDPNYSRAIYGRASTYYALEEYKWVIIDTTRVLEMGYESLSEDYRLRGKAYFQRSQYYKAINDFNAVIEAKPEDGCAYDWRGVSYWHLEVYSSALDDTTRAIELGTCPNNLDWVLAVRGDSYYQLGQYELAIADFSRSIELDSDREWVHDELAKAHILLGMQE